MLSRLTIRDFAVVSEAEIALGAGMTVISGETGAGKSLLVDALLLLGGSRADSAVVRHGAERAELSAEFALDDAADAAQWLRSEELDDDGQCQVRRVIRADGGSRAWINGRPVALAQLQALAERLVEIHGQHEAQALLSRAHQLELLDAYGGHQALTGVVAQAAAAWSESLRRKAALQQQGDPSERLALLRQQLDELERDAIAADALDALNAEQRRLGNASTLIEACHRTAAQLAGDDGNAPAATLGHLVGELSRAAAHEPALAEIATLLDSARIQIDEAQRMLERVRDGLDLDPERLREIEQRLGRIHDLARKHRVPASELPVRRDAIAAEVDELTQADALLARLDRDIATQRQAWLDAADALGSARRTAAIALANAVTALMQELGMAGGRFEALLEPTDREQPSAHGAERVEFLVSANAGQPPRALRKVASGGELSRISLAIEVAALGLDAVPSMVFDEVDSGIGGAVAEAVGRKLRALGERRQVLCVTHLPQVAALGHHHIQVSKDQAGGVTRSQIAPLDRSARIEELARMLGGLEITQATRAHAKQMLGSGQA
jgi:DNA repair protein RecN (Recombination protein N)